jgi:glutamine---fructose-6-phosphate transaminase (isomerizing)
VEALLADVSSVEPTVEPIVDSESVAHVARGLSYAVAPEGALKMKETAARAAEGFSSADFLHGPIALTARALAVVCYGWPGPVLGDGEGLAAILLAVRAQQLALSVALALGRDPHRPAGLHKVTATT